MESIYPMYKSISSPRIDIRKYFEQYHDVINSCNFNRFYNDGNCSISTFMPPTLDEEELDMLEAYCSTDKLKVPEALGRNHKALTKRTGYWTIGRTKIPDDTQLFTLKCLRDLYEIQSHDIIKSHRKYQGELPVIYDKSDSNGPKAIPGKDTVIYIRVYQPFLSRHPREERQTARVTNVVAILGSQTLDKLRDIIKCTKDLATSENVSENPQESAAFTHKDFFKSAFFFIEGTFYNDCRDSDNKDNSLVIRQWAESRNIGIFTAARMEDTRIDSLYVKFGFPWVYQHQGCCEHLIVFSDARLLSFDDELVISAYPRIHRLKQRKCRYCTLCGSGVVWVIRDSDRYPNEPTYLCINCFKSYNYIDGKKVGEFKAYRYPHHPELLVSKASLVDGQKSSEN